MSRNQSTRSRIVVDTGSHRYPSSAKGYRPNRNRELWVALSVIAAGALATRVALFLTSRPYDPMNSTFGAQQTVPQGPVAMPSASIQSTTPTQTPTPAVAAQETPQTGGATALSPPDDA